MVNFLPKVLNINFQQTTFWNIILFSQETGFDISYKLSPIGTICMKCQILFSGKIRKVSSRYVVCCLIAQRVLNINFQQTTFWIIFLFFPDTRFDISCKLTPMSNSVFWFKSNIIFCYCGSYLWRYLFSVAVGGFHTPTPETDNCPSWISGRERMTVENISWSISMKEHYPLWTWQKRQSAASNLHVTGGSIASRKQASVKCMLVRQKLFADPGFSFVLCAVQLGKLIRHPARYMCMFSLLWVTFILRGYVQHVFLTISDPSYDAVGKEAYPKLQDN